MEVYTLNNLFQREQVVDVFESVIWTDRRSSFGDFELILPATAANKSLLTPDTRLSCDKTNSVMTIETALESIDEDGRSMLTVKGKSLEAIFDDRVAMSAFQPPAVPTDWVITGKPADVARKMIIDICIAPQSLFADQIPLMTIGTLFLESNIPEPQDVIKWKQPPASLYSAVKDVCDSYDLGFRTVLGFNPPQIIADVYTGNDRTSGQSDFDPVVFSQNFDNLQNTTSFRSVEGSKNVAYVYSSVGSAIVIPADVNPAVNGLDRRILLIEATDVDEETGTSTQIQAALRQKGNEELLKTRSFSAFDGELTPTSNYKYNVDYSLGDLVELRSVDGTTNLMRVTEQIFVEDKEGERSYPTLTINSFITPGSWLSWKYNQMWPEFGSTEFWANQE